MLFRSDGVSALEPRKSFKAWSETVVGKCKSWTDEQQDTPQVLLLIYGKVRAFLGRAGGAVLTRCDAVHRRVEAEGEFAVGYAAGEPPAARREQSGCVPVCAGRAGNR